MLPEMTILILTLYKEASARHEDEMMAVARVIQVRSEERELSVRKVCLQPYQFSCWNGRANKRSNILKAYAGGQLRNTHSWELAKYAATQVYLAKVKKGNLDDLPRWNHYYNPALCKPTWAGKMKEVKMVGHQVFGRIEQ